MIILIIKNIVSFLRLQHLFKQSSTTSDTQFCQLAREVAKASGIRGDVHLLTSHLVQSPMLIGYFSPTIVLPPKVIPKDDAQLIFAHELTHFHRGDLWKKLLIALVQCIHWFNPSVYFLGQDYAYWMETSCDEHVVSCMTRNQRKIYGYLLINYAAASQCVASKVYVSFTPNQYKLKRRIASMLDTNRKPHALLSMMCLTILTIVCISVSTFAAAAYDNAYVKTDNVPIVTVVGGEAEVESNLLPNPDPNDPVGSSVPGTDDTFEVNKIDLSKSITVNVGNSWSKSFDTETLIGKDHNAFKVIVSNVSGSSYKVIVENNHGWSYSTSDYTDDCTVTITNTRGIDIYTVYILNTGTGALSADVKINSYYSD